MTIQIVNDGIGARSGVGTRVLSESGEEIDRVSSATIHFDSGEILTATIELAYFPKVDYKGLVAKLGYDSFERMAEAHGYKIVTKYEYGDMKTGNMNARRILVKGEV